MTFFNSVPDNNITEDLLDDLLSDTEFGQLLREELKLTLGDQIRLKRNLDKRFCKLGNSSSNGKVGNINTCIT